MFDKLQCTSVTKRKWSSVIYEMLNVIMVYGDMSISKHSHFLNAS